MAKPDRFLFISCLSAARNASFLSRHSQLCRLFSVIQQLCVLFALAGFLGLSTVQAQTAEPDPALREALRKTVNEASSFLDRFDAEVWLVDMSARLTRHIPDPEQRLTLLKLVHLEANRADLSPELVLAVIHVESAFDPFAYSSAGAQGLMQVMPFWKKEIGRPDDNLMDMATNLRYGCTILKHYLNRERGSVIPALSRYNGSYGQFWYPAKVLDFWNRFWSFNYE